ncbi:MAG: type IV pilin protein [Marinicella sp.]
MKNKGFSLIELMIVIAILALLIAYAVPGYRSYVLKSKRGAAQNRLMEIAGMYEKYYANINTYPTGLTGGADTLGLPNSFITLDDYTISAANTATGWSLTATATGHQTADTDCPTITFDNLGNKGPASTCWE